MELEKEKFSKFWKKNEYFVTATSIQHKKTTYFENKPTKFDFLSKIVKRNFHKI